GDAALRAQLEALLAHADTSFLDEPALAADGASQVTAGALRLAAGTQVGAYEVVRPLGAGGMGEVYRARDRRLGRDVALKFLTPELARDSEARERLRREALAASALNHPHICTLHDIIDDDGRPVLVMEIVEGEPLNAI